MRRWMLMFCSGLVGTLIASPVTAEVTLGAPSTIAAGAKLTVSWTGEADPADFITVVASDSPEGKYGTYKYTRKSPVELYAPDEPGSYELRFLSKASGYPTLARSALEVTPVTATLEGPATVQAGGKIEVSWTGPGHDRDFITVVKAGAKEKSYAGYVYTKRGNPAKLTVPEEPGAYEVRYLTGQKYYTLATHAFEITGVGASLSGPETVTEGSKFTVQFQGTGNVGDFITIVEAGTAEGQYGHYAYARDEAVELTAPAAPGAYEIRYLTARQYKTLASQAITVGLASASLEAPAEVPGGENFLVTWSGVGNASDYITIVEPSAGPREYGVYSYVRDRNPVRIRAPFKPGDYELRYALSGSRKVLATLPLRVTEPEARPGSLRVVHSQDGELVALPEGAAVELILDASGSMLKRQDGQRRIDIAKTTLSDLVRESLPAGTPFALRVFGHREADSCRTDLEIPLSPLSADAAAGRIAAIEARNLAKTPIAASLERVAEDLAGVEGSSVIVLVTDGEETCGGDPAAAVEKLRGQGFDVRVNIVGFAIDDDDLKAQFQYWAEVGGGTYHDAGSASALSDSIRRSLRAAFQVLDADGRVVASGSVGGPELELPAGDYRVRVEGRGAELPVAVASNEQAVVDLGT
ncbi:MAG: VWA domain-containing protein [Acidobacteriota bacterium]